MKKILLFDLDGTLLRTDKTISTRTLKAVGDIREKGFIIGISTSRSESNSLKFLSVLTPDVIISSGGALITMNGEVLEAFCFNGEEVSSIIAKAREICGDLNITADTPDKNAEYFLNFTPPQDELEKSWGKSIMTDFKDFRKPCLKLCFEISDELKAKQLENALPDCDWIHFTDGDWYKATKSGVTKENAIIRLCEHIGADIANITAFGDDLADIGMLKMCGMGVAMGNALEEVKTAADITIASNDEDGIAEYLESLIINIS